MAVTDVSPATQFCSQKNVIMKCMYRLKGSKNVAEVGFLIVLEIEIYGTTRNI